MIWMQLTRTNAVFSRIALVSSFCAEKSTFGKCPDFYWKHHNSPEDPRSRKGARGGCTRQPHHRPARPGVGPRPPMGRPPRAAPDSPLWTPCTCRENRRLGFRSVQFREYFMCNFPETKKQQKTHNWHYGILLIG